MKLKEVPESFYALAVLRVNAKQLKTHIRSSEKLARSKVLGARAVNKYRKIADRQKVYLASIEYVQQFIAKDKEFQKLWKKVNS